MVGRESSEAQAGCGPAGQAQPRAPHHLLSVPSCPCTHHASCGQGLERTVPDILNNKCPLELLCLGAWRGPILGDTLPPHMAHSGPTLSYPVSQVRSGEQDLKGLVQSLRLAPWVDRSISMTPSLRMALSSFRSRRNVVLGHPGGEIGWEQGWAVCCGSAISCPS